MRPLRTTLVVYWALLASACECTAPERCPGGEWFETEAGGVCVISATDAGLDPSDDPTCELRGYTASSATRLDGLRMTLGPATVIGESFYSNAGRDLVAHDGALWWMETSDRCGVTPRETWWGMQTFRFRGDREGRAIDVMAACETETYFAAGAQLFANGDVLSACFQGHHPYTYVTCGRLGDEPGQFEWLDELDPPRAFVAGERTRGVVLRWQNTENGEQGLRFYGADGRLQSEIPLVTTPRLSEGAWVAELGGVPQLARPGPPGTPLIVDRLGEDLSLLASIELDGFPADRVVTPSSLMVRDGDARLLTFLSESVGGEARIHLALVGADGGWGSRVLFQRGLGVVDAAISERGQLLVLTHRVDAATHVNHVELWRFGCDGTLLEDSLAVDAGVDLRGRAIGIEPGASRAWVALSLHDYDDIQPGNVRPHYVHSVRSVRVP